MYCTALINYFGFEITNTHTTKQTKKSAASFAHFVWTFCSITSY